MDIEGRNHIQFQTSEMESGKKGASTVQPFGVEFEGAKDFENLGEQRHIYIHGLTAAGNISRLPR